MMLDLDLEAEEVDTIAGFVLLQLQHFLRLEKSFARRDKVYSAFRY